MSFTPGADDPFAAFQMRILTAVAQLERNLIKERQREGIALAKQRGVYRGRAKILTPSQIAEARSKVDAGVPKTRIARELGCGRTSLYAALEGKGAYAPNPKARGPQ